MRNKAGHAGERRRESEAVVSCENAAGGMFPHPAKTVSQGNSIGSVIGI